MKHGAYTAAATLLVAAAAASAQQNLPPGAGRELVATRCYACHSFDARVGKGYTAQGWQTVLHMMANQGAALSAQDMATMVPYLAQHFPERHKPPAAIVPGPVQVDMQVFPVRTPGARPHDPLAAREGSLRYTGQMANVLGRFDPRSERFQSSALPGGGRIVRNTAVTAAGDLVLANSLANTLTLVRLPK